MKRVERSEILDYVTYEERRNAIRNRVLAIKQPRRVHVAGVLTFLFENTDTIRYQIQEMVRAEHMVKEADIQFELDTYNELLPEPGDLACTLLIEIEEPAERDQKLRQWLALPEHLYLKLADGSLVRPTFDERQRGEDRLSSVQYLKFATRGREPMAVGTDLPELKGEVALTAEQRQALREDIGL